MATKSTLRPRKRLIGDAVIELKTDSPRVQILDRGFHFDRAELIKRRDQQRSLGSGPLFLAARCCAKAQWAILEAIGRGGRP
jgi:hypothetical protein